MQNKYTFNFLLVLHLYNTLCTFFKLNIVLSHISATLISKILTSVLNIEISMDRSLRFPMNLSFLNSFKDCFKKVSLQNLWLTFPSCLT